MSSELTEADKAAMRERNVRDGFPTLYFMIYPRMKAAAERLGYALVIHGSVARDLDVVAIPWTDEADAPEVLTEAVRASISGLVLSEITH